jgi:nicotinamide mononucleotide transporter
MTAADLLAFVRANWLEVLAVLWGVLTVWLTVRQNIWCWPVGSASNVLFTAIFFREKLYADMALQVIYIGLNCYGWYEWLYGGREKTPLSVSRTPGRARWLLGGAAAAGIAALTFGLRAYTDASLPFWDSTTTILSLVAQYMLARKWIESWWVWITVNVLYIGIYAFKELYFTSAQQFVFIWLSLLGFAAWRKELAQRQPASVAVTTDDPQGVSDPPRTTTAVER